MRGNGKLLLLGDALEDKAHARGDDSKNCEWWQSVVWRRQVG
jgi:hypothetical protein